MEEKYSELRKTAVGTTDSFDRLFEIVRVLRAECPWDKVQTHETLRTGMIEEAYEAVDAVNKGDTDNLREELGDVMLQVVLNSIIAEETGEFSFDDVANEECEKMIRRHPHIFSNEDAKSVDKVLEKWENIKQKEKGDGSRHLMMQDVPLALPALIRSFKIQKKAADVGFDWDDVSDAFKKIDEETAELLKACEQGQQKEIEEEVGDLLFSVVNVARFLGVNPELALTATSDKFIRRFTYVEETAQSEGRSLTQMTLDEMDELWNKAKSLERV